jgi:hypothetical protein
VQRTQAVSRRTGNVRPEDAGPVFPASDANPSVLFRMLDAKPFGGGEGDIGLDGSWVMSRVPTLVAGGQGSATQTAYPLQDATAAETQKDSLRPVSALSTGVAAC